jgi:hypothetical protein
MGSEPVYLCIRRGEAQEHEGVPAISDIALVVADVEAAPEGYDLVMTSFDGRPAVLSTGIGGTRWMLCFKRLARGAPVHDTAINDIDVIWTDRGEKPVEV